MRGWRSKMIQKRSDYPYSRDRNEGVQQKLYLLRDLPPGVSSPILNLHQILGFHIQAYPFLASEEGNDSRRDHQSINCSAWQFGPLQEEASLWPLRILASIP